MVLSKLHIGYLLLFVINNIGCNYEPFYKKPRDFNFELQYGHVGHNRLSTFSNQYSKISAGRDTTIEFHLTNEQMDSVYSKIVNIKLFEYPTNYQPEDIILISPSRLYNLKVMANGMERKFRLRDNIDSNDLQTKQIKSLIMLIIEMIERDPEYLKLPPSGVFYM